MSLVVPQGINKTVVDGGDLVVISNCKMFPQSILEYVIEKKPYVVFFHDYWHCRWRGFMPLADKCMGCMYSIFYRRMYNSARLLIWLSPLHRKMHLALFPELERLPYACIPSPIDTEVFQPQSDVERQLGTCLYVGPFTRYKGTQLVLAYSDAHPEFSYTFVGDGDEDLKQEILKRGHRLYGGMPHEALPRVYSAYEYFIHLCQNPLPFERTVGEAYACGCKLIVNSCVGAMSYDFWREGREAVLRHLSQSPKLFWESIEKEVEV